jgi:hypothetical protein
MVRVFRILALLICAVALFAQYLAVIERTSAAVWNWYKFWGYGGYEPLVVGRQAQLMFYVVSAAFTALSLFLEHNSKEFWFTRIARWQFRSFIAALVIWTAVLASPLIAPFETWR